MKVLQNCSVVDLFSGVGGLTHGFVLEGFNVTVGIDADEACKYPYEHNNTGANFVHSKIEELTTKQKKSMFPKGHLKILVGCAPCQPFSAYTRVSGKHESWNLLYDFADLISEFEPEIVSMENVPRLTAYDSGTVYKDFTKKMEQLGYYVSAYPSVYAPDYGVAQRRNRLILFASKYGYIELLRKTRTPRNYSTVRDWIGGLDSIEAGGQSASDPLHKAAALSGINLKRIKASKPGGTWEDWDDDLVAACHKKDTGKFYKNVYGRMAWDALAPTITTQCYGFGNGRFGHPEQDRAISMREAALLQTFPATYRFVEPSSPQGLIATSRLIGNAVPVVLARVIAKSIKLHLYKHIRNVVFSYA